MRRPYPGDPSSPVSKPGSHHPPSPIPVSNMPLFSSLLTSSAWKAFCSSLSCPISSWECAGMQPLVLTREKETAPTPVFLPGNSHGQRSQAGYSPRGCKESDMTERLSTSLQGFPGVATLSLGTKQRTWLFCSRQKKRKINKELFFSWMC